MANQPATQPEASGALTLGSIRARKVTDIETMAFATNDIFPGLLESDRSRVGGAIGLPYVQPDGQEIMLSFYSTLLEFAGKTVLIDTCCGNDKSRPERPGWHQRAGDYLERLAEAGKRPEDIDYVMCTHLHADHVGWNTRLVDGRWVPTFPNAEYIFGRTEYQHWQREKDRQPTRRLLYGSFDDSVLPVIESGQAKLVDPDFSPLPGMHLEDAAGHTPGSMLIHVEENGRRLIVTGDVLHHAVQLLVPDLPTRFCHDPEQANAVRGRLLGRAADSGAVVVPGHFCGHPFGRITEEDGHYRFTPVYRV